MVLRKKKIIFEGKEIEVEMFDTSVKLTKGENPLETINELFKEEQIEKEIKKAIKDIKEIKRKYDNIEKNLDYCYEVGGSLKFIDKNGYQNDWRAILIRMVKHLETGLFVGRKTYLKKPEQYIILMYFLAKVPKGLVRKASWDQWYEIIKFEPKFTNGIDMKWLNAVLIECKNGFSGPSLRQKIKTIVIEKT